MVHTLLAVLLTHKSFKDCDWKMWNKKLFEKVEIGFILLSKTLRKISNINFQLVDEISGVNCGSVNWWSINYLTVIKLISSSFSYLCCFIFSPLVGNSPILITTLTPPSNFKLLSLYCRFSLANLFNFWWSSVKWVLLDVIPVCIGALSYQKIFITRKCQK